MNLTILQTIRQQVYQCYQQSGDALFELMDALSSECSAHSLPELSLSPFFQRRWCSVYEALEDGRIDEQQWTRVWTKALLAQQQGRVWISVDSTSIPRPEAHTSRDRSMIYLPNLPHATKPVSVGWQFSTLMLLPEQPSRWGALLSQRRISTSQTAISVAISQLEDMRAEVPESIVDHAAGGSLLCHSRLSQCLSAGADTCLASLEAQSETVPTCSPTSAWATRSTSKGWKTVSGQST